MINPAKSDTRGMANLFFITVFFKCYSVNIFRVNIVFFMFICNHDNFYTRVIN